MSAVEAIQSTQLVILIPFKKIPVKSIRKKFLSIELGIIMVSALNVINVWAIIEI